MPAISGPVVWADELNENDRVSQSAERGAPFWEWIRFSHNEINDNDVHTPHFVGPDRPVI
jgi:hypothetical protein